jgi:hypothetical protein
VVAKYYDRFDARLREEISGAIAVRGEDGIQLCVVDGSEVRIVQRTFDDHFVEAIALQQAFVLESVVLCGARVQCRVFVRHHAHGPTRLGICGCVVGDARQQ